MSIVTSLFRYKCILQKLALGSYTIKSIEASYETACAVSGIEFIFSNRTFLRDKKDILTLFGVDIKCVRDKRNSFYYLDEDDLIKLSTQTILGLSAKEFKK